MSELSGLELRKKALLARGFSVKRSVADPRIAQWLTHEGEPLIHTLAFGSNDRFYEDGMLERLPAIESDPAVSEPMFLEWCEKNGLLWDLYSTRDGQISCAVYKPDHNGVHAHVFGATPSEARARAIVASPKEEGFEIFL